VNQIAGKERREHALGGEEAEGKKTESRQKKGERKKGTNFEGDGRRKNDELEKKGKVKGIIAS